MKKDYSFEEHVHRYACWTAARAAQRSFTNSENIKNAIEATDLRKVINSKESFTEENFDIQHKIWANGIINHLKSLGIDEDKVTYGRAAKIINIYIKTAVVLRDPYCNLSKIAHPPIDRILLQNIHKENNQYGFDKASWTSFDEQEYFDVIEKLRKLEFDYLWKLERFWEI
ncbi:hypothetical protein [Mangrovivirga cuniculi]|uniref:Uncharacterized protein n=1 Tax=Mangrovivirga cuniculi TaxID=2715131 RepID=A0A4D7KA62_9BACT|nr:hypothetical protein [Mangrovivirga cuniculi]QCK16238.1 hypothetical protein DCC35_16565 [Mangrovivirga cuniculi]